MTKQNKVLATVVRESLRAEKRIHLPRKNNQPLLNAKTLAGLQKTGEIALAAVAIAGIITITAVAPNIWKSVGLARKWYKPGKRPTSEQSRQISTTIYYLKRHGYITLTPKGLGDYIVSLTPKGRRRVDKVEFDALAVPTPPVWDKQWWCVAGDIPTKEHRQGADLLRRKLKHMGFASLQRSMWFYPFDPRTEINQITKTFEIGHFVTVMRISLLDKDDEHTLMNHFRKLKLL